MIQRLEAVEIDDITRIAYERFKQQPLALGALGNLNGFKVDRPSGCLTATNGIFARKSMRLTVLGSGSTATRY